MPYDKYAYYAFHDYNRIKASFKDDVPIDGMVKVWCKNKKVDFEWNDINNKLFDSAYKLEKDGKGINMDYFCIVGRFVAIEKAGYKKLLKPYKELAGLWGIPLRTFERRMGFLKSL